MRKTFLLMLAAAIVVSITACGKDGDFNANDNAGGNASESGTASGGGAEVINGDKPYYLSDVGKSFNEIKKEYPALDFAGITWGAVHAFCLSAPDGDFYYYFYGTDNGAGLQEVAAEYGDKLKVAGVISSVGEIFPEAADGTPLDEFFNIIGISDYEYDYASGGHWVDRGFIRFGYNGFDCEINVSDSEEFEKFEKLKNMKQSFPCVYVNAETELSNDETRLEYENENNLSY